MTTPAADRDVLAAIFAARLSLVHKTEDEVAEDAQVLRRRAIMWVNDNSQKTHSFRWFCDVLGLEAGDVRKRIRK